MGRRRTTPPVQSRPDRIPAGELAHWMQVNDISANLLAHELVVKYRTVQGWLRGYRPTPAWLEQRINYVAMGAKPKLPFYGKRWPVEAKEPAPPPLGGDPDKLPTEDEGFVDERGQVVWYEED